jgi:hypothetical protein
MALSLFVKETVTWDLGQATVSLTGNAGDDWLIVMAGGAPGVTSCVASTVIGPGVTSDWVTITEDYTASQCWYFMAKARVMTAGNMSVGLSPVASNFGWYVVRATGSNSTGVFGVTAQSVTQIVNLNVQQDSAVAFLSLDASHGAVGSAWVPSAGATLIERSVVASTYTVHAAYWSAEAVGARDYGSTGAAGTQLKCMAVEILETPDPPSYPPVSDGPELVQPGVQSSIRTKKT